MDAGAPSHGGLPAAARAARIGQTAGFSFETDSFMQWLLRTLAATVLLALALCLLAPWLAYEITLARLERLPDRPQQLATPEQQAEVWRRAGGEGPPALEPLNPYGFVIALVTQGRVRPGEDLAVWVARDHLLGLPRSTMMEWHLRNAALTVWLTRHWTVGELTSAAHAVALPRR